MGPPPVSIAPQDPGPVKISSTQSLLLTLALSLFPVTVP
jgi:hypothetical protein